MTTALILRRENLMRFGVLFLLAFALRWSYVTWKQVGPRAKQDAQEMERVAISWAEQGRLADAFADGSGDTAHVGPLYPMLLGSVYRMLGTDAYHRFICRSYLGILATCLGIALIPTLAAMLSFDRQAGLAAGIVLAVAPTFFWLEIVGDWEQSTTALVLIVLLMLFIRLHDSQWRSWLLVAMGGLSTGLATLFSPTLAPAFALMIVAESLSGGTHSLRRMIPRVAILACIAALTMVPWTIRNYRAFGGVVPTRSSFGMNLWMGNNPESIGRSSPWDQTSKLSWDNPFTSRAEARPAAPGRGVGLHAREGRSGRAVDHPPSSPVRRPDGPPVPALLAAASGYVGARDAAGGPAVLLAHGHGGGGIRRCPVAGGGRQRLSMAPPLGADRSILDLLYYTCELPLSLSDLGLERALVLPVPRNAGDLLEGTSDRRQLRSHGASSAR